GGEPLFPSSTYGRVGPGIYRYELEIARRGSSDTVTWETLFFRPHRARKRFRIFERAEKESIKWSRFFPPSGLGRLAKLRPDVSIVSTYAQFGHEVALAVQQALRKVFFNLLIYKEDLSPDQLATQFRQSKELLNACNHDVRRLDLGLAEIKLAPGTNLFQFCHDSLEEPIPWIFESHGTQSFLRSFPRIWWALQAGGCALLDELDASIHPDILKEILRWFRDPERNPRNGQLFFTCQNTALLADLQKEEIVLCEKDGHGFTDVFPLADVKNVRRGENFFRGYRSGSYGALPNIG
ncbi:AAA family ATPase, partial [Methylacidimicrobium tartarophylax]|uniref:AAA family ATPase n=1 Tax=Methylacidimicrobium tartarophylax TaxID=1041768 RepID=UPI0011588BEB